MSAVVNVSDNFNAKNIPEVKKASNFFQSDDSIILLNHLMVENKLNMDNTPNVSTSKDVIEDVVKDIAKETIEVMYNDAYGNFEFSKKAIELYCEKKGIEYDLNDRWFDSKMSDKIDRHDIDMLEIVKELGLEANGSHCKIKIEKIPAKYKETYKISEYDGLETVDEFPYDTQLELKIKKLTEENSLLKKVNEELRTELTNYKKI